jgi:hypothetical protein
MSSCTTMALAFLALVAGGTLRSKETQAVVAPFLT